MSLYACRCTCSQLGTFRHNSLARDYEWPTLAPSTRSNDPSAVQPAVIHHPQTTRPTMYAHSYSGDASGELCPHWSVEQAATGGLVKAELSLHPTISEVALLPESYSVSLDMLVLLYPRVNMCYPRRTVYPTSYL